MGAKDLGPSLSIELNCVSSYGRREGVKGQLRSIRTRILILSISGKPEQSNPSPTNLSPRFLFRMGANNKLRCCRRGITTVTAVLMLLLMFSTLIGLIFAYYSYNLSAQEQTKIERERAQERIALTKMQLDENQWIVSVTVNNTGTIEVKIRALYQVLDGTTTFLFDPSTYMAATIAPSHSLSISFPEAEILFNPRAKIVAATERGIKTIEYEPILLYGPADDTSKYDPTKLYIGPLMLEFDDFWYQKVTNNGDPDPKDPTWYPGWEIPKGSKNVAWNITVMNIDNRNITINRFSSFTAVPNDSPSDVRTWFLEPKNLASNTQFLQVNVTNIITFIWATPKSIDGGVDKAQSSYDTACTCMVFLTFFGVFHELDGTTTAYAQTIPFEAAITVT